MRISRLVAAASLAAACAFGTSACTVDAPDGADPPTAEPTDASRTITTQFEARTVMRELWTDHVTWMRVFLIDFIAELPDAPFAQERLLQNQTDIGNVVRLFYGEETSAELTRLLRAHVVGAAQVIVAAKDPNLRQLEHARDDWYANAWQIGALLAKTTGLPEPEMVAVMNTHLDQTLAQVNARLAGNWVADIEAYDAVSANIVELSDTLSERLAEQFPEKVAAQSKLGPTNEALHLGMSHLWMEHVAWTRFFLISKIADLPDTGFVTLRLLRNPIEIGDAVRPYHGDAVGTRLTTLLQKNVLLIDDLVSDLESGGAKSTGEAEAAWYANASSIATFLAKENPSFSRNELESLFHTHLDHTHNEVLSRFGGYWSRDVQTYDAIVQNALVIADTLSDGIAAQFPRQLSK